MASPARKPKLAEGIAILFDKVVYEAHWTSVMATMRQMGWWNGKGDAYRVFRSVNAEARDIAKQRGFQLTAVYERDGWWTSRPTKRIAALYQFESLKRNLTEQTRNATIYSDPVIQAHETIVKGSITAYVQTQQANLSVAPAGDYVLTDIDKAVAAQAQWVLRPASNGKP